MRQRRGGNRTRQEEIVNRGEGATGEGKEEEEEDVKEEYKEMMNLEWQCSNGLVFECATNREDNLYFWLGRLTHQRFGNLLCLESEVI